MPAEAAVQAVDWVARYDDLSADRTVLSAEELGLAARFLGREAECEQA